MQLLFYAPKLTQPTQESLRSYSRMRFSKLTRLIPDINSMSVHIRVERQRHNFVLTVEIPLKKPIFIEVSHSNLYAAIDQAYDVVKRSIRKTKEKYARM